MPEPSPPTCPHLGLSTDRQSTLLYADTAHRCFASGRAELVELDHQEAFCLSGQYRSCPRFVEPPEAVPVRKRAAQPEPPIGTDELEAELTEVTGGFSAWRIALWALVALLLALTAIYYGAAVLTPPGLPETPTEMAISVTLTSTSTHTPVATDLPTPTATLVRFLEPAATPTPPPGGANFGLSPATWAVGWVASNEERVNHFGDSNIYSGVFDGVIYHGAIQFDLSAVPRGAPIYYGSLELAGLNDDRLGQGGVWELRVLSDTIEYDWPSATYQDIHNARVVQSIAPALSSDDLGVRKINVFNFSKGQLNLLEKRVLEEGKVSFRVDGPLTGANNLFSWDSGYGPTSQRAKPKLFLSVGPPPMTPPPHEYIVVTNTPTPENVLTAAAMVVQATIDAETTGTVTPTPRNLVTATPPDWVVVTNTPKPKNEATAQILAFLKTAEAITTGTATPTPPNIVTATWTPTPVVVTNTPTAENVFTAAAVVARVTADAMTTGTATATPRNLATATPDDWVVVTSTSTPENEATAQYLRDVATAEAFAFGTATPTPANMATATPTATYVIITSVPTPGNLSTAIARGLFETATAIAEQGTPTPLPPNWVTPVVIVETPTPEDPATATVEAAIAMLDALLAGTPTPTPPNLLTATPTSTYVIITSVPTPGNLSTAIARGLFETATAIAEQGTPTPLPPNWVTPVVPENLSMPANPAEATAAAVQATLDAMLVGTPTPPNLWTATPTGTPTSTPTYVIITSVPTSGNLSTAIARGLFETATAIADQGTPTPLPPNWVTPVVIVETPTPEDPATATVEAAIAMLDALLAGTPTPTPPNLLTATPTPTYVIITSVPTSGNLSTAIARGLFETATAIAEQGTPTPLPPNWVTPVVPENLSMPANPAEATAAAVQATLDAMLVGTPTPPNLWTATPTATPTSTPTYVIITSVPTPGNPSTAIARGLFETATAIADQGTPTPLPPNWVTPVVIVETPTPEDPATATVEAAIAMLDALLAGTPTPTPPNLLTATPTPTYVIITSVPTSGNLSTAIARGLFETATAIAEQGTPTPLPPNWVTPVVPENLSMPANPAEATAAAVQATLDAMLVGTSTPPNLWTATPTGTPTSTPTYVIITSVPTPGNLSTAIARGLFETATAIAEQGTPTPLPPNWVTPVVIVETPTPEDPATATVEAAIAMLDALLAGTPTPTPPNLLTATPTPTYVIITSVPTSGNLSTAIARGLFETATAIAEQGTPTPLPPNLVTPVVIVETPTPEDPATATVEAAIAMLDALLAGTPTPTPPNLLTATPTPTYVIITSVPTSGNLSTAIARGLFETATAIADQGTPTPLPPNWVTPVVVEVTSTPASPEEAVALAVQATVNAALIGTPTPTPPNVAIATPTPWIIDDAVIYPSPTPVSPDAIPDDFVGRIVFMSDRDGGETGYYVMDRDGSNVQRLSGSHVYEAAVARDRMSLPCISRAAFDAWARQTWLFNLRLSWSPECSQIAFSSDRTLNQQIWVMDFRSTEDWGRTQTNISDNPYNDWNPVWIKPPVIIEVAVTP